jgi:hypothetical protein
MKRSFQIFFAKAQGAFQRSTVAILYRILNGSFTSKVEFINKELDQTVVKFKNKKGGYKILKTPLIYYSGMFSYLLVLLMFTFITTGCDKPNAIPTTNEQTLDADVPTPHDLMGNEEENDTISTNYDLVGTKWQLEGFVNNTIHKTAMIEAEPKCDNCYTLVFDTDSTARGHSVMNIIGLSLKPVLSMWVATMADDTPTGGTVEIFYEAIKSVKSYRIENDDLKIFYNNNNNYLLYKLIEQ